MGHVTIRYAAADDSALILQLIRELAEYERLLQEVVATEETVRNSLFGEQRFAEVLLADVDGKPAGFALFFHNFSTFLGKPGLYLEDVYVRPDLRGRGVGKALMSSLARIALERNCGRIEWAVLNWNEPAIGFYRSLGALPRDQWTTFRLKGAPLEELAREEP